MHNSIVGIGSRTHAVAVYAAINSLRREPAVHTIHLTFILADREKVLPGIVGVPAEHIKAGYITLNVSNTASPFIEVVNDTCLHIPQIRFKGVESPVTIPLNYLLHAIMYDGVGEEVHRIVYEPFMDDALPAEKTEAPKRPFLKLVE